MATTSHEVRPRSLRAIVLAAVVIPLVVVGPGSASAESGVAPASTTAASSVPRSAGAELARAEAAAAGRTMLLGAIPAGSGDTRQGGVLDLEGDIGRELDYVRVFELWNSTYPTAYHSWLTSGDRIMALSVRAKRTNGSVIPWSEIATMTPGGALDNELQAWITRMIAIGAPVWFTFHHEPEIASSVANGTATDYIAAWRRVVTEFRARGATNVKFAWIVTGYGFEVAASDRRYAPSWYPGDAYVDIMATDTYNWSTCREGIVNAWRDFSTIPAGLKAFGELHPDKDLVLTEWASAEQGGDKAAWIDDARTLMQQPGYEQFIGMSYFNKIDSTFPSCQWPLTSSPAAEAAFVRLAQDPFFGYSGGGPGPVGPAVTWSVPVEGSVVSGVTSLGVVVGVGDAPVSRVQFSARGSVVGTDTDGSDGWGVSWETAGVADGAAALSATATDSAGLTDTASSSVTVRNLGAPVVSFVVASPVSLSAGEVAVRDRLTGWGYDVRMVDDTGFTLAGVAGAALVVVGHSTTLPAVATALHGASATVLVAKPYLLDELGMTGLVANTDYGAVATTAVVLAAPASPMAAGLSGSVAFYTGRDAVHWGLPATGATTVATAAGRATMFAYPPGTTLADGTTAAGCRVSFPLWADAPTQMTTDAWAMLEATTAWALTRCS